MRNRLYILLLSLLVVCSFVSLIDAQTLYFPPVLGSTWEMVSPEDLGYNVEKLDTLDTFLEETNTLAFILLQDGKIVHERYFGNFTQDSFWLWNSAGKTMTAMLVGIAQQDGLLSIDDATSTYLGRGWTAMTPAQEDAITIRNQLTMTSGLDDNAGDVFCTDPACLVYAAEPGTRWAYHNGPYTLLDGVLESATGENLNAYVRSSLRSSTGITGGYIRFGYNNVFVSTPRSMARFGLLNLGGGMWNGNPVLGDSTYFREMTTTSQSLNPSYGYLWWLNGADRVMLPSTQIVFNGPLYPSARSDAYTALGKDGQIIAVTPSKGQVWIRMGQNPGSSGGLVANLYAEEIFQRLNDVEGISDVEEGAELTLVLGPNPTNSEVMIEARRPIKSMKLYSSAGALLRVYKLDGALKQTLTLEGLPKGAHVLVIEMDGEIVSRVLVVE